MGEGGYRPQTLESIFLEKGKSAAFTVTLSRLKNAGRAGFSTPTTAPVALGALTAA